MFIEIRKAGFQNKGAELMLLSALTKLKSRYPDAIFVMQPTHSGGGYPFHKFAVLGFHPKAHLPLFGLQLGNLAVFIPKKIREMYGLVLEREIDIIIDAAGFSYGDAQGEKNCKEFSDYLNRWSRPNKKCILLPQAFGPFSSKDMQKNFRNIAETADLIFARDEESLHHTKKISPSKTSIRYSPDFTNLTQGIPSEFRPDNDAVAVIPNHRMIEKTSTKEASNYIPFMSRCIQILKEKNKKPFILVHDTATDKKLAEKISKNTNDTEIIVEEDPLKIKTIIGNCESTIGSRFHGLVSALSQGVPSIATGWTHKYKHLLNDYDCPEMLISCNDSEQSIVDAVEKLTNDPDRKALNQKIEKCAEQLKLQSEEMWESVFHEIEK